MRRISASARVGFAAHALGRPWAIGNAAVAHTSTLRATGGACRVAMHRTHPRTARCIFLQHNGLTQTMVLQAGHHGSEKEENLARATHLCSSISSTLQNLPSPSMHDCLRKSVMRCATSGNGAAHTAAIQEDGGAETRMVRGFSREKTMKEKIKKAMLTEPMVMTTPNQEKNERHNGRRKALQKRKHGSSARGSSITVDGTHYRPSNSKANGGETPLTIRHGVYTRRLVSSTALQNHPCHEVESWNCCTATSPEPKTHWQKRVREWKRHSGGFKTKKISVSGRKKNELDCQKESLAEYCGGDGDEAQPNDASSKQWDYVRPFATNARAALDECGSVLLQMQECLRDGNHEAQQQHIELLFSRLGTVRDDAYHIEQEVAEDLPEDDASSWENDWWQEPQVQTEKGGARNTQDHYTPQEVWYHGKFWESSNEKQGIFWDGRYWTPQQMGAYQGDRATAQAVSDARVEAELARAFGYSASSENDDPSTGGAGQANNTNAVADVAKAADNGEERGNRRQQEDGQTNTVNKKLKVDEPIDGNASC